MKISLVAPFYNGSEGFKGDSSKRITFQAVNQ
jgi:hypothetical protein